MRNGTQMIDEKLLTNVMHEYFLDALYHAIKKNEVTREIMKKMITDGLTEKEACDIMIYCWLKGDKND